MRGIAGERGAYGEYGLADLLADLRAAWRFVLAGIMIGLAAAACAAFLPEPLYRAVAIVAPTEQTTGTDVARLLGISDTPAMRYVVKRAGSPESSAFVRFEHILRGPRAAEALLAEPGMREALAGRMENGFWQRLAGQGPVILTPVSVSDYLSRHLDISPAGTTELREIAYADRDPAFAARLIADLVRVTDDMLREETRARTSARLGYLGARLEAEDHPDHRQALAAMMMEQEQIRMIVNMNEPFAAAIVEPPRPPERKHWPRPALFLAAGIFLGGFFGFLAHSLRSVAK